MALTCSLTLARSGAKTSSTLGSVMSSTRAIFRFLFAFLVPHRLKSRRLAVVATPLTGGLASGTSLDTRYTAILCAIRSKPRLRSRIRRESDCTMQLHAVVTCATRSLHRDLLGYSRHREVLRPNWYATDSFRAGN